MYNNRGLNFNNIIGVEDGKPKYKTSGYVKKGRKNMVNYTAGERKIIGECVINGKNYQQAKYLVLRDGGNDTILNEDTFKIIYRIRDYKGVDGVKHWIINNLNLEYYIRNEVKLEECV